MLSRRQLLAAGVAVAGSTLLGRRARAAGVFGGYDAALVIDALSAPDEDGRDDNDAPLGAAALEAARSSGLTAVNVTLGASADLNESLRRLGWFERECDAHPDRFLRVRRAADLTLAKHTRRLGLIYGVQNLAMVGEDLTLMDLLARLGVRVMQLTYNRRNLIGDGCLEPGDAGLSKLGRAAVERCGALRVVVDLSHAGRRTQAEAIAAARGPVAITHSGCAALIDHPRNTRDEELRALARRGGVLGVYFMPYLRGDGQQQHLDDVLRHLEHAVDVGGEDHVGIGSDGSIAAVELTEKKKAAHRDEVRERRRLGIGAPDEREDVFNFVPELNTPRKLETLATALARRGHKEARITKLLGGNFARLFGEVWG